jgi:hypothetical protein
MEDTEKKCTCGHPAFVHKGGVCTAPGCQCKGMKPSK